MLTGSWDGGEERHGAGEHARSHYIAGSRRSPDAGRAARRRRDGAPGFGMRLVSPLSVKWCQWCRRWRSLRSCSMSSASRSDLLMVLSFVRDELPKAITTIGKRCDDLRKEAKRLLNR